MDIVNNQTWIIYKITNKVNGKAYVGLTKRGLDKRWRAHCSLANCNLTCAKRPHFHRAIVKYGVNVWKTEILIEGITTAEEAARKEIEMISKYDTYANGYNSTKGGDGTTGYVLSKEEQAKSTKGIAKYIAARSEEIKARDSKIATERNRKRYNTKKQWFYHKEYGTEYMYKTELAKKYGFQVSNLYLLDKGKRLSVNGWIIIKPSSATKTI